MNIEFSADEQDFLTELSEALSLALSRMQKLEQAEMVKAQWQATFDAIPHALSVVARDFEIIKLNRAFLDAASEHGEFRDLIGKSTISAFFGAEYRPPGPLDQTPVETPRQAAEQLKQAATKGNLLLLVNRNGSSQFVGVSLDRGSGGGNPG